jgi:hypothetical protein
MPAPCVGQYTWIYFDGVTADGADPVLALVPRRPPRHADWRNENSALATRFIARHHMQGDNETVFFYIW